MFDRIRKVTGALLGVAGVGALLGSIFVCFALLLIGPAVVLGLLSR